MPRLHSIQTNGRSSAGEVMLMLLCAPAPSVTVAQDTWESWPPRDYLVRSLVAAVPQLLAEYHPETGKFGTEPWVYTGSDAHLSAVGGMVP